MEPNPKYWNNDLITRRGIRSSLGIRVEEFGNPYHDPANGRFTEAMEGVKAPGGGATLEVSGAPVKTGYMVAVQGHSSITSVAEFFSGEPPKGQQIIFDWLKKNRELFKNPKVKVGLWHDEQHGEIVIDPAEQFTDRALAMVAGRSRNQQGIYHLDSDSYIETGGTGDRDGG